MDLESLYDCPDLLADRVRKLEILHPGTRGNRLKSAAPALAPERLQGDVGAAPGRERSQARRLATERADRVRRRGRGQRSGYRKPTGFGGRRTYSGYSSSGSSRSSSSERTSTGAFSAAGACPSRRKSLRFFRERTMATTARRTVRTSNSSEV